MESLQTLKYMVKERDYMCKIDLKDAYFTIPLDKSCRHLVRFLWEGNLYEFLCLCFGLRPAPRVFTKILKVPISLFAPSKYQNFDLPGRHVVNVSINRETSSRKRHRNLSPSTSGICNKLKKVSHGTGTNNRIFRPCDKFDSNDSFFNRRESERNFTRMQNNIFNERDNGFAVNTISRSSIIHHTNSSSSSDSILLPAASISVIPERRNVLQRENYSKRSGTGGTAVVDRKPKILQWEVSNSGQASESNTDRCPTGRLGSQLYGCGDWGKTVVEERKLHINILELLAVENSILAFTKEKTINPIDIQTDNTTALSYLLKMGGTTDKTLVDLSKDIWKYLILKQITITAEHLRDILNTRADWQSRHSKDFSE